MAEHHDRGPSHPSGREVLHATVRGAVAAMSMSGMRLLTTRVGLVGQTPPEMVAFEHAPKIICRMSPGQRDGLIVLMHWAYGAGGGTVFGLLPDRVRLKPWAGPIFGAALWLLFEVVLVPVLGLQARRGKALRERAALAADHLLYGAILSEFRRRPSR
ncbi:hypothetical protein [Amycolatopsis taiwanensis]|uniref:DUF1440 domain-containing protein n=1 Tax=Amycolatopsis taiwanensis TaxID=342230 RepID=A0A9W6R5I1_9PSEU|nr:hypothetical protein [Amycolatopsis taiwanensis]GLY67855.1 hypothetical protein Atai01_44740 [Amycolatopsis taiwanensis]